MKLRTLDKERQHRLDELMRRHNEGQLGADELDDLRELVADAEAIAPENAQRLAARRPNRGDTNT